MTNTSTISEYRSQRHRRISRYGVVMQWLGVMIALFAVPAALFGLISAVAGYANGWILVIVFGGFTWLASELIFRRD